MASSGFRKIVSYFPAHWKAEAHPGYYLVVAAFLGISLYANYFLFPGTTIERRWMWGAIGEGWLAGTGAYFVFYALPYFFAVTAWAAFSKKWHIFRSPDFWLRSACLLLIFSLDASFTLYRKLALLADTPADRYLVRKIASNLGSVLTTGVLAMLFWWWRDRRTESWYGLTRRGFQSGPYWILLALMTPIVLGASFMPDFISYYPTLKVRNLAGLTLMPQWAAWVSYELAYLSDFLWTELAFRGMLVIGMAEVLGAGAVLPAASVYCYIHFAKPLGEAASSIFGGYILGVIALRSRNILGGVMVHMGIAFLMELFAILQNIRLGKL